MPAAKQLAALTTFVVSLKDGDLIVRKGDVIPANHPAVKGREELFQPFDPSKPAVESPVEAATAAPGEQRE